MAFSTDLIAGIISLIFTLLIFSYLLGDNPLFKIAVHLFIGVSSGFIASIVIWQLIVPQIVNPILFGSLAEKILAAIPLLGGLFILLRISSRLPLAFMTGTGAAVAVAGAVTGTLLPQVSAVIHAFDLSLAAASNISALEALGNGAVVLIGTALSLAYFHFGAHPRPDGSMHRWGLIEMAAWGGRLFIGIALGAIFAGIYDAALTALIERSASLINFIFTILGSM